MCLLALLATKRATEHKAGVRIDGLLSFERLGLRGVERTARAVRIIKVWGYASDDDYVFASETMKGKQPNWRTTR